MDPPSVSRRHLLAAAGVGAAGTLGVVTRKRGPDTVSTQADSPDWPLVHHDARNTGANRRASGPESDPDVRWRARRFGAGQRFDGYLNLPTPAVVGDTVFVGGPSLSALRVRDGTERWSVGGAADETFHGAGFADGTLYVSTRYPDGPGVAAVAPTGERRWRRRIDSDFDVAQPPLVAGETVYVPGYTALAALGAASGTRRWRTDAGARPAAHPAVTDDALYAPTGWYGLFARDRRQAFHAVPLGDPPRVRWRYEPDEMARPAPAVGDDGRVFVPETEEWYPEHDEDRGKLAALAPDGSRRWAKPGGTVATSPVVVDGTVYCKWGATVETVDKGEYVRGRSDARIAARNADDGSVWWTRRFGDLGSWAISPVSDGDRLYVPLHDGAGDRSAVVALDAATGETRWRRNLASPAYHLALAGRTLYVATANGTLFAFE
ncbi:PQQ-binding-like beta-propeller repeat protein [Halorussus sp. AFM4]|uniref:outer membrane protein assembly factor BamB family protein n=1 Tax=Halorussus sp. AFM4 TaxID=3421651 RepID=UPI003EBF4020